MTQPSIYALLVGIDRYDNPSQAPHLRGCVADTQAMYNFLTTRLQVPEERILWLTSTMEQSEPPERRATRANILRGWQRHLTQAGPEDQVFFHYSGHGAQAATVDPEHELDGLDETIVPADSRTRDIYDILDKELAALIATVEARGAKVTCFMDCCHSGSGTRTVMDTDEERPRTRLAAGDTRVRPPASVVTLAAGTRAVTGPKGPSGLLPISDHVLLSGCRDEELSHEYRSPETGQWHGATTYFLLKKLAAYQPGMTWAEVHDYVQSQVNAVYARQSPQLEGAAETQVFGGLGEAVSPYIRVTEIDRSNPRFVRLGAGVAVGLTPEARLAVFPPASSLTGTPQVHARVTEVKADHSWAELEQPVTVELGARATILSYGVGGHVYRVACDEPAIRSAVAEAYPNGKSPFFDLVPGPEPSADWRVTVLGGKYAVQDATGTQIVLDMPETTPAGAAQVVKYLEHLARYRNAKSLANPDPYAALTHEVKIRAVTGDRLSGERMINERPLRSAGGECVAREGEPIQILVETSATSDLYVSVFVLDGETFGVQRVFPHPRRGPHQRVVPGMPPIKAYSVNSIDISTPGLSSVNLTFKVFATKDPTELDALQLPPLNRPDRDGQTRAVGGSSLARLINAGRHDGTRVSFNTADTTDDDWTAAQLEIKLLAATSETELPAGQEQVQVGTHLGITLTKPMGFVGRLITGALNTLSSRDVGGAGLVLPNLGPGNLLEPVGGGTAGTRAAGSAPMVLELETTGEQLAQITAEAPLHLEMDVPGDPAVAGLLPVAYDGRYFHIVGEPAPAGAVATRAAPQPGMQSLAVDITHLPLPESGEAGEEVEIATRDIKRTIRLLFFKMTRGTLPSDTGLRKAELNASGQPVYSTVSQADLLTANRVALMIHGFTSDSGWMVSYTWPKVQRLADYDLCLTFDYETFNTGIKENGEKLAKALQTIGFGPDDGIQLDIYSHSMGTQVSRALVEMHGGNQYVNRVFMGGPLNAGTALAKAQKLLPWLSTVMLNGAAATVPPVLVVGWALKQISDLAVGVQDMSPDSPFFRELNGLSGATGVAYYVQIGDNSAHIPGFSWDRLFQKSNLMAGLDAGLDLILGGENDLAVSVNSARNARNGTYPDLTVRVTTGNHFHYFVDSESEFILREWLQSG